MREYKQRWNSPRCRKPQIFKAAAAVTQAGHLNATASPGSLRVQYIQSRRKLSSTPIISQGYF